MVSAPSTSIRVNMRCPCNCYAAQSSGILQMLYVTDFAPETQTWSVVEIQEEMTQQTVFMSFIMGMLIPSAPSLI